MEPLQPIPMFPPSLDFLNFVTIFRIVILTWNRPESLLRLLNSLEQTEFNFVEGNPHWQLLLEIRVDGGGGAEGASVEHLANTFNFSHGRKVVVTSEVNMGIMEAWRNAWSWKEQELFIVIEDDVEMSPQWYRALVYAWFKYARLPEMAGVGLQKQTFVAAGKGPHHDVDVAAKAGETPVFLYTLPASIGTSPHPWHWARMIQMYGHKLSSCPDRMSCVKSVWESWWLKYCMEHTLFSLYFVGEKALAVDHREAGYHQKGDLGSHSGRVEDWSHTWELPRLPMQPVRLDLYLQQVSDLRLAAMQLAAELGKVELLVVTEENRQLVTEQLAGWNESDPGISRERLERLLFVSPVPISLPKPAKVLVETPSWVNTSLPLIPDTNFDFHVHVLLQITMQAVPVTAIPDLQFLLIPSRKPKNSTLVVGRKSGQASPDLRWLSTDGSFAAFNLFAKIDQMGRQEGSKRDLVMFLQVVGSSSAASSNPLTWTWGPVDFNSEFKPMDVISASECQT